VLGGIGEQIRPTDLLSIDHPIHDARVRGMDVELDAQLNFAARDKDYKTNVTGVFICGYMWRGQALIASEKHREGSPRRGYLTLGQQRFVEDLMRAVLALRLPVYGLNGVNISLLIQRQDNFAEVLAVFHSPVGLSDLIKRVGPVDNWRNGPVGETRHHGFSELRNDRLLFLYRT